MSRRHLISRSGAAFLVVAGAGLLMMAAVSAQSSIWKTPRTPWGDPDFQGIWTTNEMHGVPLERPAELAGKASLSQKEADERRERTTQGTVNAEGIGNYDRAFRDTALGYTKQPVSTQTSLIVDPPDGRLPPMTPEGRKVYAEERSERRRRPSHWLDFGPWQRCITRGVQTIVEPSGYNNGVQIVQGPGYVAIQKEMIHETRIVPIGSKPHLGSKLALVTGDARGHWEGDTLVVDLTNFNGKAPLVGSGKKLHITERFTRIGPNQLEYRYTVDDPTVFTRPWTVRMTMSKDDSQYELVEYACHEANYAMANSLSGTKAEDAAKNKK